jgi:hypothetical protein
MRKKSVLALLAFASFAAAVVVGMGASAAFAGEVTGNCGAGDTVFPFKGSDKAANNCKDDYSQGNSICKFSGQNDHTDGSASGPGGRTQSYGQDVSSGRAAPNQSNPGQTGHMPDPDNPHPGDACNGNHGFHSGP